MLPSEVTRALREDALTPASLEVALADVRRRARRARLRNSRVAVLAAASVAAIAVTVPLLSGGPGAGPAPTLAPKGVDTTGAVPWSERTDYYRWEVPAPAPRALTTPCTASDLSLAEINQDGAMQRLHSHVYLEKRTNGRCTLPGHAVLTGLVDGQRVVIPTNEVAAPGGEDMESPATLERGEIARTSYLSVGICESNQSGDRDDPVADYRGIALQLPDRSSIPLDRDLRSSCTPGTTPYYRDSAPIEEPTRWPSLSGSLDLPERVESGEALEYVVTLSNPGDEGPIALAPCGGFRQELLFEDMNGNPIGKPVADERRLSCDGNPVLEPGESQRYVMRLAVPATAPRTQEARLVWHLLDSDPGFLQEYIAVGTDSPASSSPSEASTPASVEDFVAFAATTGSGVDSPAFAVGDAGVRIGLGRTVVKTLGATDATNGRASWELEADGFAGRDGSVSALASIQASPYQLDVAAGEHPHCAGPALPSPDIQGRKLRQFSIQPVEGSFESCIDWFAVDVFIDEDDRIAAVFLDLWEP